MADIARGTEHSSRRGTALPRGCAAYFAAALTVRRARCISRSWISRSDVTTLPYHFTRTLFLSDA